MAVVVVSVVVVVVVVVVIVVVHRFINYIYWNRHSESCAERYLHVSRSFPTFDDNGFRLVGLHIIFSFKCYQV